MSTRDAVAIARKAIAAADGLTRDQLRIYNQAIADAFNEQVDRLERAMERGNREEVEREVRRLGELAAAAGDRFEENFQDILADASRNGRDLAGRLIVAYDSEFDISDEPRINFEAVAAQARDGMQRLRNHTREAAQNIQRIVTGGLAGNIGPAQIRDRVMGQLGMLKARAENIARTETMSALNTATRDRYASYGIEWVQILAIIDDRTTPDCRFRHMKIIRRNSRSRPPFHFQCRSIEMPIKHEWLTDEDYKFAAKEYVKASDGALNQASIFEEKNRIPKPDPILTIEKFKS